MVKRYNLYYLLLEDMQKHRLPAICSRQIRENVENFYRLKKPPD